MATVPNPKTWSPATIPTAAEFNADIRDAVNFFLAPPRVSVHHSAAIDITPLTWTRLNWDSEDDDDDGIHGGTTQRLIAVTAGRYFVTVAILWEDFGTLQNGPHGVQIRKNSNNDATQGQCIAYDMKHAQDNIVGDVGECYQNTAGYAELSVSDYLEVFVYHGHDSAIGSDNSEVQMNEQPSVRWTATWIMS